MVYLLLSVLVGMIIPSLDQVFSFVWRDSVDAAVLGLFNARDQNLFLIVGHKSSNYQITHMPVSIGTCHEESTLGKGFKGCHYGRLASVSYAAVT